MEMKLFKVSNGRKIKTVREMNLRNLSIMVKELNEVLPVIGNDDKTALAYLSTLYEEYSPLLKDVINGYNTHKKVGIYVKEIQAITNLLEIFHKLNNSHKSLSEGKKELGSLRTKLNSLYGC